MAGENPRIEALMFMDLPNPCIFGGMLSIFLQPVPSFTPSRRGFIMCLLAGTCVFFILFFFEVFGTGLPVSTRLKMAAMFGGITIVISLFNAWLLPYLWPRLFNEAHWNVGKEIFFFCWMIVSIAMGNVLLIMWLENRSLSFQNLLIIIGITGLVGSVPITVSVFLKQKILLRKYASRAQELDEKLQALPETETSPAQISGTAEIDGSLPPILGISTNMATTQATMIELSGDNQQENLRVAPDDLIYIGSSDNYVRIYHRDGASIKQVFFRGSLKKMEGSLVNFPQFYRCHRTCIVNLHEVFQVSGNAQGFKLHVKNIDAPLPVSRGLNTEIGQKLLHLA